MKSSKEAEAISELANAITTVGSAPSIDESGGHVGCLTEAIMGFTGGLHALAANMRELADAINAHNEIERAKLRYEESQRPSKKPAAR